MLSFHNDPKIKEKYVTRVRKHRELDNIIQGIGWENGRGCAVGCTLEDYSHERYPIELGLPQWLAKLEDAIFEGLPQSLAIQWPEKFLNAIAVGVSVEDVKYQLAIRRLSRLIELQKELLERSGNLKEIFIQVIAAIELVKKCHESELNKTYCDWSDAQSTARSAARSARSAWAAARSAESAWAAAWSARSARSAWAAAWSAAWSAESAWAAAWSAESAKSAESAESVWAAAWSARSARSAWAAAESAESAAESAESAVWQKEADDLIDLLQNIK